MALVEADRTAPGGFLCNRLFDWLPPLERIGFVIGRERLVGIQEAGGKPCSRMKRLRLRI